MEATAEKRLSELEKKQNEIVWHNRIQTIALIVSFFGIVSIVGMFKKGK